MVSPNDPRMHPSKIRDSVRHNGTLEYMIEKGKTSIGLCCNEKMGSFVKVDEPYTLSSHNEREGWVHYRLTLRQHNSRHIRLFCWEVPISSPIPISELQSERPTENLRKYLRPQPGEPKADAEPKEEDRSGFFSRPVPWQNEQVQKALDAKALPAREVLAREIERMKIRDFSDAYGMSSFKWEINNNMDSYNKYSIDADGNLRIYRK